MLSEFLSYLQDQVDNHSIYVWGGQGQQYPTVTESWIMSKETGTNLENALETYRKAVKAGNKEKLRAFDCSGLLTYYLYNVAKLISGDMTANGLKGISTQVSKGNLRRGDWVFRKYTSGDKKNQAYHVGVVVDDALNVIEAKGRAYGVIKAPFDANYWNYYARPKIFKEEIEMSSIEFLRNLKKGYVGADVQELQKLLNNNGYKAGTEDGIFGSKTLLAVKAAQKACHMTVDGIAGRNTITALGGTWGKKPQPSNDITICSFNIKRGTYKNATQKIIGGIIKGADIVGVQEVTPSGLTNIAKATGLSSNMCTTIAGYGHGILTNFGTAQEKIITLGGSGERRKVHHLQIGDISFYNTHLHYTATANDIQLKQLAEILSKDNNKIIVVTGDFNRQLYGIITSLGFKQTNEGQNIRNTEGGASIVNKIDQVFVKGAAVAEVWKYEAVKHKYSDHDALFVRIKL